MKPVKEHNNPENNLNITLDFSSVKTVLLSFKKNIIKILLVIAVPASIVFAATVDVDSIMNEPMVQYYDGDSIIAADIQKNFDAIYAKVNLLLSSEENTNGLTYLRDQIALKDETMLAKFDKLNLDYNKVEIDPSEGMPSGMVLLWSGDPSAFQSDSAEWKICDNDDPNTPDLGGRIAIGSTMDTAGACGSAPDYALCTIENSDLKDNNLVFHLREDIPAEFHTHSITHEHGLASVKQTTVNHKHAWLKLEKANWKFSAFDDNNDTFLFPDLGSVYGYSLTGTGSAPIFGVDIRSGTDIIPSLETLFLTTEDGGAHNHPINKSTITSDNFINSANPPFSDDVYYSITHGEYSIDEPFPPYKVLYFVRKQ